VVPGMSIFWRGTDYNNDTSRDKRYARFFLRLVCPSWQGRWERRFWTNSVTAKQKSRRQKAETDAGGRLSKSE